MRPGQQNKRGRGRNNGGGGGGNNFNRKGANPLTRTYDSSGPDVKIRGTAQHIAEKYAALARDAQGAGDRVMAENYLQHAEHYNRIIAAAQAQMQERFQRDDRDDRSDFADDMDGMDEPMAVSQPQHQPQVQPQQQRPVEIAGSGPQPVIEEMPAEVAAVVEESGAEGAGERQPRRRNASNRPRRQPRRANAAGETSEGADGAASTESAPVLAEAASE
ncbi:DUF4167 domain-containing protein [Rhizobium cremeum]|uniref:DUF4167 domain-containing protein n=1 Tax=Rhizobium cremeum TaxID=2813827 RepID=UPI000DDD7426|nr:DUF4167 domain-containing protein [Rhizobium cremeum]MCJ7994230.1 DUF4167 domain-containing protein [Rhizobium cremeum]MCJ7999729.1 DUF4167 domain-containing protein [Rhizobium cremeum]